MSQRDKEISTAKERSAQAFRDFGEQAFRRYFGSKYEGIISNEIGSNNPLALAIDRRNGIDGFILTTNGARAYCSKVCFKAYDPKSRQFKIRYSRDNGLPTEFFKISNGEVNTKPDFLIQIITGNDTDTAVVGIIGVRDFLYACRRGYAEIEEYKDSTRTINIPFRAVRDCKSFFTRLISRQEEKTSSRNNEGEKRKLPAVVASN